MSGITGMLQSQYFVGREDALREFDAFLNNPNKRIFLILGEGGVGKTWLLLALRHYAQSKSAELNLSVAGEIIDLLPTRYHRISELWAKIAQLSGQPDAFKEHFEEYEHFQQLRDQEKGFIGAERALQDKSARVHELFYKSCTSLSDMRYLYWFDTFESVRDDQVGRWLVNELPNNVGDFRFIIAGRHPGARHPEEHENLIQRYELKGFSSQEIEDFYRNRYCDGEPQPGWYEVCEKLQYFPLYIDLARLWVDSGVIPSYLDLARLLPDEIIPLLFHKLKEVTRIPGVIPNDSGYSNDELREIESAAYQVILFMAFLDRRFNAYFLECVYPSESPNCLEYARIALHGMSNVPSIFFVKKRDWPIEMPNSSVTSSGYLQLHDKVRDSVIQILWPDAERDWNADDPDGNASKNALARSAIAAYNDLIQRAEDDREQEELRVEQLYYELQVDFQEAYEKFRKRFDDNLKQQNWGICQLLINAVSAIAQSGKRMTLPQKRQLHEYTFRLTLGQRYFEIAESLADTSAEWTDYWLASQEHYVDSDLKKSKYCAQQAFEVASKHDLSDRRARAERALGYVCRALGQLDEAIRWYQQCQKTAHTIPGTPGASLYAFALNNEGYIWALQGEYEIAAEKVGAAQKIRSKHYWEHEEAQSLSTLGEIARFRGDFHVAGRYYRAATEIFDKLHAYDWVAILWQQRAEDMRCIAEEELNNKEFKDEYRIKKYLSYAVEDIDRSLALYSTLAKIRK